MPKLILAALCLFLTALGNFSQTRKIPAKPLPKQVKAPAIVEISQREWEAITKSLETEDWEQTALLSGIALKKISLENEKRQLARLRYLYLFSLAGKTSRGRLTPAELQNAAQVFINRDFIMLDRNVRANCQNSLNYICPVKSNSRALRVTATNKQFTVIHSFENVKLLQAFNFTENDLKTFFVGGKLKKIEVNTKPDKVWVMRLFFEDGWVQAVEK